MMQAIETRHFVYKNLRVELRLFEVDNGFAVIAFIGDKQISPRYSSSWELAHDWYMQHLDHLKNHLFGIAQSDIESEFFIEPCPNDPITPWQYKFRRI